MADDTRQAQAMAYALAYGAEYAIQRQQSPHPHHMSGAEEDAKTAGIRAAYAIERYFAEEENSG